MFNKFLHWLPGLAELIHYRREYWRTDVAAGLSVAAVALPVSIAYAELAGFSPVVGLYSTMLPMIIYAFAGSSRQLIVGPDAATCAMISATLAPLAHPMSEHYLGLAVTLTLLAGLFCLIAGRFQLGFVVDFLSRPILTGVMNGVAISIIVGQIGKVTGVHITGNNLLSEVDSFLMQTHLIQWRTVLFSGALAAVYLVIKKFLPKAPAALLLMGIAIGITFAFDLPRRMDLAVVGHIPSGFPTLHWPVLPFDALGTLIPAAAGLALISFNSTMLTARSFAARNGYSIDANREFYALGAADIASALSQGFAISGADSRTAVNDASGGKTRMVSIIGALSILCVLLFFTRPLAWMPSAALGVILILASVSLLDFKSLWRVRKLNKTEFWIAVSTIAGLQIIGVMPGILLAVLLALMHFLAQVARPADQELGYIDGQEGFFELEDYPAARPLTGLIVYRFESPLTFFNADYFRKRIIQLVDRAETPVYWVVIDTISLGDIDVTGVLTLTELGQTLYARNITLAMAGRAKRTQRLIDDFAPPNCRQILFFPTRLAALSAYCDDMAARFGSHVDPAIQRILRFRQTRRQFEQSMAEAQSDRQIKDGMTSMASEKKRDDPEAPIQTATMPSDADSAVTSS